MAIDGIKYREDSLNHLATHGYLTIERGADTLTISWGPVTVKLADSFRETVVRKAD